MASNWSEDELDRIGAADELQIATRRADGTLRRFITIWVVRVGDELFVRSAYGPDNAWFRRAVASGSGRIRAGGVERDVTLAAPAGDVAGDVAAAVDAAYHTKYDRYGDAIVNTVVGPDKAAVTLQLAPTDAESG